MANRPGFISYTFVTMASICFVSGLLVLTGGEPHHGSIGGYFVRD